MKWTTDSAGPRVLLPALSLYPCRVNNDSIPTPPQLDQDAKGVPAKKPYAAPALVRWGTLHELTQSAGYKGASDGARKGATRTSW